jgi:hypothetical protein
MRTTEPDRKPCRTASCALSCSVTLRVLIPALSTIAAAFVGLAPSATTCTYARSVSRSPFTTSSFALRVSTAPLARPRAPDSAVTSAVMSAWKTVIVGVGVGKVALAASIDVATDCANAMTSLTLSLSLRTAIAFAAMGCLEEDRGSPGKAPGDLESSYPCGETGHFDTRSTNLRLIGHLVPS